MKRTSWLTLSVTLAVLLGALAVEAQRRRQPRPPKNRPRMADTVKANIYADNWFKMYINGKLIAIDSIEFVPHNIISVDILPEYPMTVAVLARDFADAQTGLEYNNTRIGDGGFILKFGDGTVTSEAWKAKKVFWGPLNGDIDNPKVGREPIPEGWYEPDFDDSSWPNATEFTREEVRPNRVYNDYDFEGAEFIWTEDLELDNTILFRHRMENPGR